MSTETPFLFLFFFPVCVEKYRGDRLWRQSLYSTQGALYPFRSKEYQNASNFIVGF